MRTRRVIAAAAGISIMLTLGVGCAANKSSRPEAGSALGGGVGGIATTTSRETDTEPTTADGATGATGEGAAATEPTTLTTSPDNIAVEEPSATSTSAAAAKAPSTTSGGVRNPGPSTTIQPAVTSTTTAQRGRIVDNGVYDINGVRHAGSQTSSVPNCSTASDWTITYWFRYENGSETKLKVTWSGWPIVYLYQDGYGDYAPWTVSANFRAEGEAVECGMGPTPGM